MKFVILSLLFCTSYACTSNDSTSDYTTSVGVGCINLLNRQPGNFKFNYSISGKLSFTKESKILFENFQVNVLKEITRNNSFELRIYARNISLASFQPATGLGSTSAVVTGAITGLDSENYAGLGDFLVTLASTTNGSIFYYAENATMQSILPLHSYVEFLVVIFEQSGTSLNAQPFAFQKTNFNTKVSARPTSFYDPKPRNHESFTTSTHSYNYYDPRPTSFYSPPYIASSTHSYNYYDPRPTSYYSPPYIASSTNSYNFYDPRPTSFYDPQYRYNTNQSRNAVNPGAMLALNIGVILILVFAAAILCLQPRSKNIKYARLTMETLPTYKEN